MGKIVSDNNFQEGFLPHNIQLIAIVVLAASLAGILSSRLSQLPMVGYVIAGIIVGPHVLSFVTSEEEVRFLAELGVILLLFVLGIELPIESFKKSYRAAVPVTLLLVAFSVVLTMAVGTLVPWSFNESLVYAFVISLSSTAVGVKLLKQLNLTKDDSGQVALAVLIAQDLIFVPMIITINSLGGEESLGISFILKIAVALIAVIGLVTFLSKRVRVHLLFEKWVEKHDELIPVAALAWCFVGAALSQYAGLSPAFGAFLGGLVIGNSHSKEKVFPKIEPLQSVLLMVFFVSIGMLIDLKIVWQSLGVVLCLVFFSMLLKTIFCMFLLRVFLAAHNWRGSYATGIAISQIGEFSFVLASAAMNIGLVTGQSYKILVAVIAINLALSPFWLILMKRLFGLSNPNRVRV